MLFEHDDLEPFLDEWEVRYAAIGAVTCLAVAGISTTLPGTATIADGSFDLFGLTTQEITVVNGLLGGLVGIVQAAMWPLLVIGVMSLALDAYLAVRPRQPIGLHYVCAGQMLLGFLAALTLVAIFAILLANVVTGLLLVALVVVVGIVVLGGAAAVLGALTRA